MKNLRNKQQGLTMMGLALVLGAIGAVVLFVLTIAPVYMRHGKIKSALESIATIPEINQQSKAEILTTLNKRLSINSVESLGEKDVVITKFGDYLKVQIKYDVEKPLVGNLSALMKFDEMIEVGKQ